MASSPRSPAPAADAGLSRLRSALLGLSTRIAESRGEDDVCRSVVEGLQDEAFGFEGVGLYLAGSSVFEPELKARSARFTPGAAGRVSELKLPLRVGESAIGELVVQRPRSQAFERGDLEIAAAAASQASIAIARARLIEAERTRTAEQRALLDTLQDLSGELELDRLLQVVLERAVSLLDCAGGELAVYDEGTESLVIVASHNMETNAVGTRMALGEGAMGHAGVTRESMIIPNYREWEGHSQRYESDAVRSVMVTPLLIGSRLVGAIASVHSDPEREFGQQDLRLLNLFAAQAAIAIENARLFEAERHRAEEQKAILQTMQDLSGELELSKVLHRVLERAVDLLGVSAGELATWDESSRELVIVASHNMETNTEGTRMALGEGAMGRVAETHEPLIIPRYQEWELRSAQYAPLSSVQSGMAAPLLIGNRLVGVIAAVHSDANRELGPEDMRLLLLFAPQAAIAIENARLYASAQRYFDDLVLNNPVAIANLDNDFNIVSCNPAFERLYGYVEQEIIGRNLDDLVSGEGALTESTLAGHKAFGTGKRRRKDGTMADVEIASIPVMVGGERMGMLALYHDISELVQTRHAAEAASRSKSQFLANMSHELRTPLNAIIGYSEMLMEEAEDEAHAELAPDLGKIHSAGKHLLALINDILDLSKIEAGKMDLFLEVVDLARVVEDVTSTVQPLAEKNDNRLDVRLADGLGTVHSDVTRIRQVLLNLLSNACKFTENGTVRFEAAREAGPDGADWVRFTVTDEGIGMTEEQIAKLFQAFSQAEVSTAARFGGTGLGLAISRQFCRLMGGDITVASREGEGSAFTVRLPVVAPAVLQAEAEDGKAATAGAPAEDGAGGVVLVVDDDPNARDLMARHLRKEGFRVVEAASGPAGLEAARVTAPDVITLDVLMPGMDGWAVLMELKKDPALAEIPVIMATITDQRNLGMALGASEYLTKPIDRERLAAILRKYARENQPRTVLIVEDDASARSLIRRALEREGWTVDEAENGRVALEKLAQATPALVLLDLMMPEMDGFEFLEVLRTEGSHPEIPVVVITAKELTDEDRQRLNGGVERIVAKGPRERDDFLREVRDLVALHARPAAREPVA